jgi:hypothetical protein
MVAMSTIKTLCFDVCYDDNIPLSSLFKWGLAIPQFVTVFSFGYNCTNKGICYFIFNVLCFWCLYFCLYFASQALEFERPQSGTCISIYDKMAFPDPTFVSTVTFISTFVLLDVACLRMKGKKNLLNWTIVTFVLFYYIISVVWMNVFHLLHLVLNLVLSVGITCLFLWIGLVFVIPNLQRISKIWVFNWLGYKA